MYYIMLYVFHIVHFVLFSSTTFLPKYFGELGMTDSRIGILMSLPAIAGVLCQPYFGSLLDRARYKRNVLAGLLGALTVLCFIMDQYTTFWPLMLGLTIYNILQMPIASAYTSISLEYTRQAGYAYGPIRLSGTVGYQLGALIVGAVLAGSLRGIFRFIAIIMLLSGAAACFLPPVRGHQHGHTKVNPLLLLKDRHVAALLLMVLVPTITSQFYLSFFSKHLGDLGIDNTITGVLLAVSVGMEIPFLIFADKLARKMSIWNWLLIGYALNAVRWLGLAFSKSVLWLVIFQIPTVSIMACFEFFPSLYLNRRTEDALKGSAQNALMLVAFGLSKVIGSLAGGFISERVGIPAVFAANGVLLLVAILLFWRPTRRLMAEEGNVACE